MSIRSLAALAVAAALIGCGDDDGGPDYVNITDARIRILAGDGQVAPVATSPERAGDLAPRLQGGGAEEAYDLFPEVLEVYVGVGTLAGGDPVAPGTDVHWIVRDEGCGRPVGQTTSTDADGRAVNRWIRGTRARACHMDVCRILSDGALACDTTFTAVQEPGPPDMWSRGRLPERMLVGQTGTGPYLVDRYKNAIPTLLVGRGALESVDSLRLRASRWGLGTYDVILADTVFSAAAQTVGVFPDLAAIPIWSAVLICETPDTTYVDRFEFRVDSVMVRVWHPSPYSTVVSPYDVAEDSGLSGEYATLVMTSPGRRLILANGDTLFDTAVSDTALNGRPVSDPDDLRTTAFVGPMVVLADTTVLLWPTYEHDPHPRFAAWSDWPLRIPYLTNEDLSVMSIQGLPPLLTLVSEEPLTWSAGGAVAACHSDGWTSATAGTWTVRGGV